MLLVKDLIDELKKFDGSLPVTLTIPHKSGPSTSTLAVGAEISSVVNPLDFESTDVIAIIGK